MDKYGSINFVNSVSLVIVLIVENRSLVVKT